MSNPIPSSLALINILTGSQILSSTHDSNYGAIQTGFNEFVTAFNSGVVNQALLSAGGANVQWAYPPGFELGYTEFTSNVSVTATTEATANTIVTASAITFDGTPVVIEFFAAEADAPSAVQNDWWLYEDGSSIGRIGRSGSANLASVDPIEPVLLRRRMTPTIGSHTFSIRASCSSATGFTVAAGAGGAGNFMPGFIRIAKV